MTAILLRLGSLGSVLRATLLAIANTSAVQGAAYRVIANTWKILNATAANQHNRVLLKVVAFTTDITGDFESVCQPHTRNLAHGRVRFLRAV